MAVSVRSLVTIFISVFLSVVRVCLPRWPFLDVLWSSWLFFLFFVLFFFCLSVCPLCVLCLLFVFLFSLCLLFAPPRSPSLVVLRFSWALSWLCLSVRVWFHYGFVSSGRFDDEVW